MKRLLPITTATLLCLTILGNMSIASEGEPIAIRLWPDGVASIETQWNLKVAFGPAKSAFPEAQDLVLKNQSDGFTVGLAGVDDASVSKIDHTLDRLPNTTAVKLSEGKVGSSPNAIWLRSVGRNLVVAVDGVRIAFCSDKSYAEELAAAIKELELSYIVCPTLNESDVAALATKSAPAIWVVLSDSGHNTLAASSHVGASLKKANVVKLATAPWTMKGELQELFTKKEISCKSSRNVFAKLSVKQLNFKPKNGTHTPRWNCEHMMGRELIFFSQIYAARSSAIKPMNLNPKQMPADYSAKHPDWTGEEEARQMKRVEDFTRRFAYLLEGVDLDKKAEGSFWTPRKLLEQMDRHYGEHTANTQKKFELQDWPKE